MMPFLNGLLLALTGSLAVSILVKVTAAMALGLTAAWLTRNSRAAVRHSLLAATFGVALCLPVGSVFEPAIHLKVPLVAEKEPASLPPPATLQAVPSPVKTESAGRAVPAVSRVPEASLPLLLFLAWIIGAGLFLLPVPAGLWQVRCLRRSGLPWRYGHSTAESLAREAGIQRPVEVLLHEDLPGPLTCGVLHPTIVLPRDAENWRLEDLRRALVHELEHVRRLDTLSSSLARIACAVYWFHPLVWTAWRKLLLEAERSCDDAVLARSDATAYADQLVELAKRLVTMRSSLQLAMANRDDLATRVGALLDERQRRGRAGRLALALAGAAAVALVIGMSPLRLVASPQAAPADPPRFEVASIKPAAPDERGMYILPGPGGGIKITNMSLKELIVLAWQVQPYQVSGGTAWVDSARFDILAKPEKRPKPGGNLLMLRSLLEDRFQLAIHRETKELPIYALVVARKDGKLGPRLVESKPGRCTPPDPSKIAPRPEPGKPPVLLCGGTWYGLRGGTGVAVHIGSLAPYLSRVLGRTVVDKTGLTGTYDFQADWAPFAPQPDPAGAAPPPDAPQPSDASAPSIFTAFEEQLGLKLEAQKGPVEVILIDRAEKPSQN